MELFRQISVQGGEGTHKERRKLLSRIALGIKDLQIFTSAIDRQSAVPSYVGQVGIELESFTIWMANGLTAGSWVTGLAVRRRVIRVGDGNISSTNYPIQWLDRFIEFYAPGSATLPSGTAHTFDGYIFTIPNLSEGNVTIYAPAGQMIQNVNPDQQDMDDDHFVIPLGQSREVYRTTASNHIPAWTIC